jgi:hypothetical protein
VRSRIVGVNFWFGRICTTIYWAAEVELILNRKIHSGPGIKDLQTLKKVVQIPTFRKSAPILLIIRI